MHLPIHAQGPALTNEQAKILDDEFFLFDPLSHFSSRISMLLGTARASYNATQENEPEFFKALGVRLDNADSALRFTDQQREVQVSLDALSLRHQAAEALTRFIYARVAATPRDGDAKSTWLAIADSPTPMIDVIRAIEAEQEKDTFQFFELLFPPGTPIDTPCLQATETAAEWADYAKWLLTSDDFPVNAANNKLKHGLATSARGDIRIELTTTPPNEDGTFPANAFGEGKSLPLFDQPILTFLSRPPKKLRQGLEITSLQVNLPVVLAETWMMANTYAAIFHTAACEHFGENLPKGVAPRPAFTIGRTPDHIADSRPLGYRSAVTSPPDNKTPPRQSGLLFHNDFIPINIDFESKIEGRIVDG